MKKGSSTVIIKDLYYSQMGLEAYRCVIYVDCGSTYCSQEKSSQEFEYDTVQQHYGDSHTDMDCKCANSVGHFLLSLYVSLHN